jgi:heptosyltransferase I
VLKSEPKNILLIKPSSLGDVVHALPVLNLLRRRFAGAKITWLLSRACAGLLEGHPQLDEIMLFDRKRLGQAWRSWRALGELREFARDLRGRRFDLVVDLQGLLRSGWMAWRSGAAARAGFANAREGAWLFYNLRVPIETIEQHAVDRYLHVAEALGCGREPVESRFHVTAEDRAAVADMVERAERYAVVLPGANWSTKRWPAERFAELIALMRGRYGLKAVVAGAADAVELAPKLGADINLAGRTSLRQLVALLERASLVVANDSGPMHIAAALGRPLVAIFGPTNPVRTGPYGRMDCVVRANVDCAPCYSRKCSHVNCMQRLEAAEVMKTVERQIGE